MKGGKSYYIARFPWGENLLYSHFSGGKGYYIAIFPGGKMARGKGYYTTPDQTSFAIHMHFIVSDKNHVNFKRNIGERTW